MADLWNYRSESDRLTFAAILSPLIVASRTRDFADAGRAKDQLVAWVMSLKDVSQELLEQGVERLIGQGVTWMPKPGDLREACAEIVEERRRALARQAQAHQADCPDCQHSPGWRETGDGRVVRCNCHKRAVELMARAEAPISRPALPASTEDVA